MNIKANLIEKDIGYFWVWVEINWNDFSMRHVLDNRKKSPQRLNVNKHLSIIILPQSDPFYFFRFDTTSARLEQFKMYRVCTI